MRYMQRTFYFAFLMISSLRMVSGYANTQHHISCLECGQVPYPSNTHYTTPDPIIDSPQVWSFKSEPSLHPMKVKINIHKHGTSSGLIFLAPYAFSADAGYGQPGSLILDNKGNPVWFRPLSSPNLMNTDFRVQKLYGKQVLTFWQGTLATPPAYTNAPGGSSEPGSCYYILDNSYKVIGTVAAYDGYTSDIHEFLLTPDNTALFLSTKSVPMDLTPYGGPQNGFVQDFAIQEVDLQTNKLIFFWSALNHIPLSDSYSDASSAVSSGNIWDAYHLNSIGLTDKHGEILVSGRNTWTIYKIKKSNGKILWRLGGKQSDFTIDKNARFSWQHDARVLSQNVISLFDDNSDGSATPVPPSHGLQLTLNFHDMNAHLHRSYYHNPNISVSSQGNVQTLPNGNRFIGWGQSQYYSEFEQGGNTEGHPGHNLLYDVQMPSTNFTYRAYRSDWVGNPDFPPSIAAESQNDHVFVYASWNGSTETAAWKLFSGESKHKLSHVKTVDRKGFETVMKTKKMGPYFQVKALNDKGDVIGVSQVVYLES